MLLYHGTSEWAAIEAMEKGLHPRSEHGMSNWTDTVESNPDAVYLTNTYPCHFAIHAMLNHPRIPDEHRRIRKRIAVIEIDTKNLVQGKFHPDEDAVEQSLRGHDRLGHLDMNTRTRHYRKLVKTSPLWEESLSVLGTCAYYGKIHPRHFTRIAFFQPKKNRAMTLAMMDGMVSVQAFRACGILHQNYTRWLFGEQIKPEDIWVMNPEGLQMEIGPSYDMMMERYKAFTEVLADRSGIELKIMKRAAVAA